MEHLKNFPWRPLPGSKKIAALRGRVGDERASGDERYAFAKETSLMKFCRN